MPEIKTDALALTDLDVPYLDLADPFVLEQIKKMKKLERLSISYSGKFYASDYDRICEALKHIKGVSLCGKRRWYWYSIKKSVYCTYIRCN